MQLTQPAAWPIAAIDTRRTTRMEAAERIADEAELVRGPGQCEERLRVALHVVEVSIRGRSPPLLRLGKTPGEASETSDLGLLLRAQYELGAVLERAHAWLLAPHVGLQRAEQPGPQRDAHFAQVRGNGVRERERALLGKQPPLQRAVDEAVGDRFRIAAIDELDRLARIADDSFRHRAGALRYRRIDWRNLVVAVDAGDFLNEIRLDGEIEAPGRWPRFVAFRSRPHAEAERGQGWPA